MFLTFKNVNKNMLYCNHKCFIGVCYFLFGKKVNKQTLITGALDKRFKDEAQSFSEPK